ncbi:hypothetical protein Q4601_15730 [Shewanella sp. 1_MG-2023]|uniref:hypothetical protein n=1 Tax=unclassified Shewanella TaxID=196818 RepID=UPI0026E26050|nr:MULTISPECIES: hypothetical protein [unclassified Shewanella]MDO6612163.1 hypothetical protein [Shewanella sp. 7_MG-2023]MDO6772017.1 hypothetical protein [Shewanella sp. 2_MG-2023]MDO6795757.1 hypothetical protein [Shewanella sp. 1_MG-2023]
MNVQGNIRLEAFMGWYPSSIIVNFAINYNFTNIIETENGIKNFEGIFIEKDDPSRLALQQ